MKYENIKQGFFIERPNRFIANVAIGNKISMVHVKNTGRCKEILVHNAKVFLQESFDIKRKTKFDLISVYKGNMLINIDSQVPNKVFHEFLLKGDFIKNITLIKPEYTYGKSRFDFYVEAGERKIFIEVKGVTLEDNGVALFPDAPTERGVKHLKELCTAIKEGYEAYVIFIVQMNGTKYFTPSPIDREFCDTIKKAKCFGVNIIAIDCFVTKDSIEAKNFIEVRI